MKLQCPPKLLNTLSDFKLENKRIGRYLANPVNFNKHLLAGEIFNIDPYCLRPFFPNEGCTISNRFFECQECNRFKVYRDYAQCFEKEALIPVAYPNLTLRSEYQNPYLRNDPFTTRVLVNHVLIQNRIRDINYPIRAFLCGNVGYLYFFESKKDYNLIKILRALSKFKFSFNSLPNMTHQSRRDYGDRPKAAPPSGGEETHQSRRDYGEETHNFMKKNGFVIPDFSSLTTPSGIRICNDIFNDFVFPERIIDAQEDYFQLNLSSERHRRKFKYLRDSGQLDERINFKLNYLLYTNPYESYDRFLRYISGEKIPYKV